MAFLNIYTYRDFEHYYKAHREFLFKVNRFWVITLRAFLLGASIMVNAAGSKPVFYLGSNPRPLVFYNLTESGDNFKTKK